MKKLLITIGFLLSMLLLSFSCIAQPPILKVGIITDADPIAYVNTFGQYDGIAVQLWKTIAHNLNYQYQFIPIKTTYNQAIKDLSNHKYDLLVGAFSVTHDRLELVNYTRPYFINQIGIAVTQYRLTFFDTLHTMFGKTIITIFVLFIVLMLIFSHLFWYFEKEKCEQVSRHYKYGIGEALWTTTVSFLRDVLYDPKSPVARMILAVWLLLSVIFVAIITAIVTATMTYNLNFQHQFFHRPADVNNQLIGVEKGTISEMIVNKLGGKTKMFPNQLTALKELNAGDLQGVVSDYFLLEKIVKKHPQLKLKMSNLILLHDEYAFPIVKNSPFTEAINLEITKLQDTDVALSMCRRFIGDKAFHCEL